MRRTRGAVEVRLMAGDAVAVGEAICTRRAERGVVALRAGQRCVRAGEREARARVVEVRAIPVRRVVALLARRRDIGRLVRRSIRALVILLVAGDAGRRGEAIRARRAERRVVALGALQTDMRAGQREAGAVVVEGRRVPGRRRVALLACRRQT